MNKRQRKKRNKNWVRTVILPFYKKNEDGTTDGLMYSYKNGKIVKAFTLRNVRLTSAGDSNLAEPNETIYNLHWNPYFDGTHINMLMNATANALKDKILSEINPQIWEYGGIKRLEYLFFRYCVQWYTFNRTKWSIFTIYNIADKYIELYPRNNKKQLLYYIEKWQRLSLVNLTLNSNIPCMLDGDYPMREHYRQIWYKATECPSPDPDVYFTSEFK